MPETLVLIPGMMCDARVFWHQIIALSGDWPVMVAAPVRGATIEEMAADILTSLPTRFALAGQGMGGNVALEIFRRAPERVSRIALISIAVQAETPQAAAAREERIVAAQAGRLAASLAADVPASSLGPEVARDEIMDMMRDMGLTLGEGVYLRQSRAMQRRPDQQKALRKAMLPALVMCGALDPVTLPRRHQFIAEMLPYGRLQLIDDAGHMPTLEQPEAVTRVLEAWLTEPLLLR
ncbi:3-oxoadipate enol-lactonase 2 [mine drainage metagenome]|uniref:3-oxoadipate enol-lactonase 2 n=1 Tax=mine drainage metagenome TaxID=410659 RepID=A0A1J5PWM1_9ZZZZ